MELYPRAFFAVVSDLFVALAVAAAAIERAGRN